MHVCMHLGMLLEGVFVWCVFVCVCVCVCEGFANGDFLQVCVGMQVCVYVYVYVCTYEFIICMHAIVCGCICVCMYVRIYYVLVRICVRTDVCLHVFHHEKLVNKRILVVCICKYICIRSYTRMMNA